MALAIGSPAPDFSLSNQDGKMVKLADFLGRYVVIYFYPRALTPGCSTQACSLRDHHPQLADLGVTVLGISADPTPTLAKFVTKEILNFDLLSDPTHQIIEKYGAWQEKRMYGKTYMGIARITYIVDKQGNIAHFMPKVDPKTHHQELLAWFQHHR